MYKNNKIILKAHLFIFSLLALVGCSTLNKNECLNADWETIGYQDGFKGHFQSRVGKHREACAEYGVKPMLDKYLLGYDKGIQEYCQPNRGYYRGLQGYINNGSCKVSMRNAYDIAYNQGKQIYDLEQDIKNNKNIIDKLIDANHTLEDERSLSENKLINTKLIKSERARLIERIRDIDSEKQRNIEAIKYHDDLLHNLISKAESLKKQYDSTIH